MSYLSNFERSFSEHTLELVHRYQGPHDATFLVNCLLGLLVVPRETALNAIPDDPLVGLLHWGISPASIKAAGRPTNANPRPDSLRGLVTNLRHSVAHFRVKPIPAEGDVLAFEFRNDVGLHAEITLAELQQFIERLSEHLAQQ